MSTHKVETDVRSCEHGGACPLQFNSEIDASAALICPGMSISGTIDERPAA